MKAWLDAGVASVGEVAHVQQSPGRIGPLLPSALPKSQPYMPSSSFDPRVPSASPLQSALLNQERFDAPAAQEIV